MTPGTPHGSDDAAAAPLDDNRSASDRSAAEQNLEQSDSQRHDAPAAPGGSRRWVFWLTGLMAFLVVALVGTLIYWAAASVSGEEFNVVTWQVRSFEFMRDPLTDTQLTSIRRKIKTSFTLDPAIAAHIAGGKIAPRQPRWDLVHIARGTKFGLGDATILLRYLEATDASNDLYWVAWTNEHPKAAPILWGAVRDAVHLARYDRLPDLFDAAREAVEPEPLRAAIDKTMLALAEEEARALLAADDRLQARRVATLGLSYGQSNALQAVLDAQAQE